MRITFCTIIRANILTETCVFQKNWLKTIVVPVLSFTLSTPFVVQKARQKGDLAVINYTYGLGLIYRQRGTKPFGTPCPCSGSSASGCRWSPTQWAIVYSLIRTGWLLRNQTPEQLERLPDTTDPDARLILDMLANVSLASAVARPKMIPVIMLHLLRRSIRSGLTIKSGAGFLMSLKETDAPVSLGIFPLTQANLPQNPIDT